MSLAIKDHPALESGKPLIRSFSRLSTAGSTVDLHNPKVR